MLQHNLWVNPTVGTWDPLLCLGPRVGRAGKGLTWSRLQVELAHWRDTPMQKQRRQPSGFWSLRWKVPVAHSSQKRPMTLGWREGKGRGFT